MRRRHLSARALAAAACFLLGATTAFAEDERYAGGFLPPGACKACHPQHYEEWRGSMHAYAVRDPVFFAMNAQGQRDTNGELGDFCIRCHAPAGTVTGEIPPGVEGPEGLSPAAAAGVSCEVCHRDVRLEDGHPENANFVFLPGGPMVGTLVDPVPTGFHESKTSDVIRRAEFCGSCHNVTNQRGVRVEKPYDEWLESSYPDRGRSCLDCHMQIYTGRATPNGPIRPKLHRHDFVGVDTALTPFPRRGFQKLEIEEFLRSAAVMSVSAPERAARGDHLELEVSVKNTGAGHNLPTGPSTERQIWLEVTVTTERGEVIFRSGHLDEHGELSYGEHGAASDPQLALFTDRFLDEEGNEVPFMWQAHALDERTIRPLETRRSAYRIDVPRELESRTLAVRTRLLFRAFPPHQLERLGIAHFRDELPIYVIAEEERSVRIADSVRVPGRVRVPEDAATIEEALAKASPGDEISLAPGRYAVARPIDFRGRDLVLRGRGGPGSTTLFLAAEAVEGAASLIRLESGETPAARIEGLTLEGGRGSIVSDGLAGGAIVALESDPTIVDCVFRGNRADTGGAVFLRASFSHLRDCVFEGNEAAERGGAIASAGKSGVLVERSRFLENRAEEGGALCLGGGDILLASEIERSRAFEGGAVRIRSLAGAGGEAPEEGFTIFRENRLVANTARRGGALLATGPGDLFLERNLLAGHLGGALAFEKGVIARAPHTTLVDTLGGPAVALDETSRIRFRNSILWGNRPRPLAGEVAYSFVDDPAQAGGTNPEEMYPAFMPPESRWERCRGPGEGCLPVVRESLAPESSHLWRRYVPGAFRPLPAAPTVDRGDPSSVPDPDGTLPDLGAVHTPRPRNPFVRGDVDGNGRLDTADVALLRRALLGEPLPCPDAADLDDDARIEPRDLIRLLDVLLHRGPPPPPPFPDCGIDGSPRDTLGCFEARCSVLRAGS